MEISGSVSVVFFDGGDYVSFGFVYVGREHITVKAGRETTYIERRSVKFFTVRESDPVSVYAMSA